MVEFGMRMADAAAWALSPCATGEWDRVELVLNSASCSVVKEWKPLSSSVAQDGFLQVLHGDPSFVSWSRTFSREEVCFWIGFFVPCLLSPLSDLAASGQSPAVCQHVENPAFPLALQGPKGVSQKEL